MEHPSLDERAERATHDIRNALASIVGCADTLIHHDSSMDAGTRRALLEVIHRQAVDVDRFVDDLRPADRYPITTGA